MAELENKDTIINTPIGDVIGGMYFYYIKSSDLKKCSAITGNCPAVHSCYWTPFIEPSDVSTDIYKYDKNRYGKLEGWELDYTPYVERIKAVKTVFKKLGSFKKYNTHGRRKERHWSNESRLCLPPYSYSVLTDYMNPPIEIRPNEVISKDIEVFCRSFISDKGTYSLYIGGLKGDTDGNMEMQKSTSPTDIPVGSTAFANWSATQKAQNSHNYVQSLMGLTLDANQNNFNQTAGLIGGGAGVLGSAISGNIGGAISGIANTFVNYQNSEFGADRIRLQQKDVIGSRSALMKDLSNTPRSMIQTGSDVNFSIMAGNKRLDLLRYEITEEFKERLADYFTLYGYKQAKIMPVEIRNRYYFNYVKTLNVNLIPRESGKGIPKAHLEEIRNIFDNGVTFWHVDNEGVSIGNYNMDNREV